MTEQSDEDGIGSDSESPVGSASRDNNTARNFALVEERERSEALAVRESQFSEAIIESMPGILYFYDEHGKFLRWNRNFEQVSGYSGAEIATMHPLQFFAGEDRRRVEQRIAKVFESGESSVEAMFVSKDGSSRPYFFTGRSVVYEGGRCLVGVGIDIARRKDAEGKLEQLAFYDTLTGLPNRQLMQDRLQHSLASSSRLQLERDLRLALEQREFCLYYQPQVDHTGRVTGAEALIRWLSPAKGVISPAEFVPLAEETGLILPLGTWVIETACAQLKAWEQDRSTAALELAINVSAQQFYQSDFVSQVLSAVKAAQVNPALLKLELTESLILDDIESAIVKMNTLREAGLRFAMDDFGTGYSSLSYLTQLPLDQLKIDQSFVHNMAGKPVNAVIVQTIIGMARNLEIEAVAEGVETVEQYDFLKEHGCNVFQGYYFGRPVPIADFQF